MKPNILRLSHITFVLTLWCLTFSSQATTVLFNAKGYTIDDNGKLASFTSVAISEGKVVEVSKKSLTNQYPDAKLIDAKSQIVIPGIIDAHGHIMGQGFNLMQVDVRDLPSKKAVVDRVRNYAENNKQLNWIRGRGWNQVQWPSNRFPSAADLDEIIPDKPVWLRRVDGHAGWANTKALEIAGITRDTLDPAGGEIIKDKDGNPSGILIDNAMRLVESKVPAFTDAEYEKAFELVANHMLELGITSAHDAGINYRNYRFFKEKAKAGQIPFRIYAMLSAADPRLEKMLSAGHVKDDFLSIRSVKIYADGALGSRGAALLKDYSDQPGNKGLWVTSARDIRSLFQQVLTHNFQIAIHAIGDGANRLALDEFEYAFKRWGGKSLRNRIEHAQVIDVNDIPRFAELSIIPSMQPTHATSDMNMAGDRVGEMRLKGAYAWKTLAKQGTPIAAGSDFPVELANPMLGLHAAVTRQDRNNQPHNGWRNEESLTTVEAFKAFTKDAAYAAHQEKQLGGIFPGAWADFVIVDRDIFNIDPKDLWKTKVLETWVAGEKVYESDK